MQNSFGKKPNLIYFRFPGATRTGNGGKAWQTGPQKEVIQGGVYFMERNGTEVV